jgi:hypothetical protein
MKHDAMLPSELGNMVDAGLLILPSLPGLYADSRIP